MLTHVRHLLMRQSPTDVDDCSTVNAGSNSKGSEVYAAFVAWNDEIEAKAERRSAASGVPPVQMCHPCQLS